MENTKTEVREKATYEQLENYVTQLSTQNISLRNKINELMEVALSKRLDYLFKVLENKENFSKEFIETVCEEITDSLTPSSNNEE